MSRPNQDQSSKDKLLVAATNLMYTGNDFSTRDVLAAAGVTAPTMYHHFGSKQGLIDAVARHGFAQYVPTSESGDNPVYAIRHGWDRHVEFGLDHPRFYARLYGNIEPGTPCTVTTPAIDMMLLILEPAAASGRLVVEPRKAAYRILAANVGVTLGLIGQPVDERDRELSTFVREAMLAAVFLQADASPVAGPLTVAAHAVALGASITNAGLTLSDAERGLFAELLERVATNQAFAGSHS